MQKGDHRKLVASFKNEDFLKERFLFQNEALCPLRLAPSERYGKNTNLNTFYGLFIAFMLLFLKILSGMANSVDPGLSDLGLCCLDMPL